MKKHIIYTIAALCMLPIGRLFAQSGSDNNPEGVILNKMVSEQHEDESYTITLESYVTGTKVTTITTSTTPCDIVLVLDVSTSMDNTVNTGTTTYSQINSNSYSYSGYGNNTYYYRYEGNYYPVVREQYNLATTYYLQYQNGRTTYYLVDRDGTATTRPTSYTDPTTPIWNSTLYTRSGSQRTGYTYTETNKSSFSYNEITSGDYYYKTGNNSYARVTTGSSSSSCYNLYFVDGSDVRHYLSGNGITETRPETVTGNRTTIWAGVLYRSSTGSASKISLLKAAAEKFIQTVAADAAANDVDHQIAVVQFSGEGTNETKIVNGLMTNYDQVITNVNSMTTHNWTCADLGMNYAEQIISRIDKDRESNKVVVMFTDGVPCNSSTGGSGNTFSENVADATVSAALSMKNAGAKVFTIGIFSEETNNIRNYMNAVSSNYPKATAYNNLGDQAANTFYQLSNGADLSSIFETIAKETTSGSASYDLSETNVVVVDVMSNLFMLPEGADASDIKTYTATCKGYDAEKEEYLFADREAVTGLNITVNEETREVDVTGFDFAKEYVYIETNDKDVIIGYGGKKLIIEIPIVVDPTNPGGANLITNNAGLSGLYTGKEDGDGNIVPDEKFAGFPRPAVIKPNVIIQKTGLQHAGESATFLIERVNDINGGAYTGDQAFEPFSVSLTQTKNYTDEEIGDAPAIEAKVKLLDYGWYKVTETSWSSWYTPSAVGTGYFKVNPEYATDKTKAHYITDDLYTKTDTDASGHPYVIRYIGKETEIETGNGIEIDGEMFYSVGTPFKFYNQLLKSAERDPEKYSEAVIINKFPTKE